MVERSPVPCGPPGSGDALLAGCAFYAEAPIRGREWIRAQGWGEGSGFPHFSSALAHPTVLGCPWASTSGPSSCPVNRSSIHQSHRIFQVPLSRHFHPLFPGLFSLMVKPRGPVPQGKYWVPMCISIQAEYLFTCFPQVEPHGQDTHVSGSTQELRSTLEQQRQATEMVLFFLSPPPCTHQTILTASSPFPSTAQRCEPRNLHFYP